MTVVRDSILGLGTGISPVSGIQIDGAWLNSSVQRQSPPSWKFSNGHARWSSENSQICLPAVSYAKHCIRGHEIDQSQSHSVESVCSVGAQPLPTERNTSSGLYGCLSSCMLRVDFSERRGAEELLTLGLVAGALLFPEQSWAVDMETVATKTTAQGLMAWAANEPANALSLPTWIIHIASVAEWVTAMALVWKFGDAPGKSPWKGLTWGMVPLLGGAMCACTWHFFYNAPSLEVLVVLQAFLTVVGNFTMWAAAYRIWKASDEKGPVK